jgi:hypothetical protein
LDLREWSCHTEHAIQQQARKLPPLHRTIAMLANMPKTRTTLREVQWQGMKSGLEDKEIMRHPYQQDDQPWGEGTMYTVARAVAAAQRGQKEVGKADGEDVGLEASIPEDLTQTGGPEMPEERQQLQHGR